MNTFSGATEKLLGNCLRYSVFSDKDLCQQEGPRKEGQFVYLLF